GGTEQCGQRRPGLVDRRVQGRPVEQRAAGPVVDRIVIHSRALPRDLESAETALAAVARRRTDPRAEANANAVVVRVLLEAGTLHRRCVGEAQRTVALWQNLAADLDGPVFDATGHDLQRLSDAASHLGLAAARFGD